MLYSINGIDITKNIITNSYSMNAEDVYEEWTDANYRKHREVIRQRVGGRFTLKFLTEETYTDFVSLVANCKSASGSVPVTAFVTNQNREVEAEMYIAFSPQVYKTKANGKVITSFEVEVSEP